MVEKYNFRLSNGDILTDSLSNLIDIMSINGLTVYGCLQSGRLEKVPFQKNI